MAVETLANMNREDEQPAPTPDWQGVSQQIAARSIMDLKVADVEEEQGAVLNADLNNEDDDFGGFGLDDRDDDKIGDDQFVNDRNFDDEGFPIRAPKPRPELYKRMKAEMARRKSLAYGGLQQFTKTNRKGDEVAVRRSSRRKFKPLEYWRGEAKIYSREHHQSLPTVDHVVRKGRNPMFPQKTPGGHAETYHVVVDRPGKRFRKMGAEKRDSMPPMSGNNGTPLYDDDSDEEVLDGPFHVDQHGRYIKKYRKTIFNSSVHVNSHLSQITSCRQR